jgi:hypothetical protein
MISAPARQVWAVFDVYADVQEQFYERAGRRAGPME